MSLPFAIVSISALIVVVAGVPGGVSAEIALTKEAGRLKTPLC